MRIQAFVERTRSLADGYRCALARTPRVTLGPNNTPAIQEAALWWFFRRRLVLALAVWTFCQSLVWWGLRLLA